MRTISESLNTDGSGLWSKVVREVQLRGMSLIAASYDNEDGTKHVYGELRVFFAKDSWDTSKDGLIYTDRQFQRELREYLTRAGYESAGVGYSECGMQGDNYVSLDVNRAFIESWNKCPQNQAA